MSAEYLAEALLRSLHQQPPKRWLENLPEWPMLACDTPPHPATLELRAASLHRGAAHILKPVSATLRAGQLSVIVGPNGAGKSSLLALLSGQTPTSSGSVYMNGEALRPGAAQAHARVRSLLPQENHTAFDYRVQEIVALGRYPHRRHPCANEDAVVQGALRATGIQHLAHRCINTLSGGERARAHLARVLAQIWGTPDGGAHAAARWLLLDEPTAALDLGHQHEILRMLHAWAHIQGVGVVAVLHDLNLALRYADWVLVLHGGHLHAQGRPQEILDVARVNEVWQVQSQAVRDANGVAQLITA